MAGHLIAAGHQVTVYNRTPGRAEQWRSTLPAEQRARAAIAATPAAAAEQAEIVCLCVGNDDDVRAVTLGAGGVLETLDPGGLLIDHTTASAELAVELDRAAAAVGIGFVDAPVSGGQAGAQAGRLTIMCGGATEHFGRAVPVLGAYGERVRRMGSVGAGQLCKMVNQVCIAGLLQGLAEGVQFAEKAGLDLASVIDVIGAGAAQSWQLDNRAQTMHERRFDFGFAVDWMRKDLGIALAAAKANGAALPVTALVDQFYGDLQQRGGGRDDTSSLVRRFDPPAT
jgi:3-hydroxyisobutyrate dehydrogenase